MSALEKIANHHAGEAWEGQRAPIQRLVSQVSQKLGYFASSAGTAVLDQGIVSGTNLITTILIGRYCGAKSLGQHPGRLCARLNLSPDTGCRRCLLVK